MSNYNKYKTLAVAASVLGRRSKRSRPSVQAKPKLKTPLPKSLDDTSSVWLQTYLDEAQALIDSCSNKIIWSGNELDRIGSCYDNACKRYAKQLATLPESQAHEQLNYAGNYAHYIIGLPKRYCKLLAKHYTELVYPESS
ncbi:hypothetical protein [Candidatus Poriferisocius sp.]|uniref:hypothetical protein n=1 Tax=Candidatus Poriferisocius sp. TaxID=3101276 RepID=UPI003B024F70